MASPVTLQIAIQRERVLDEAETDDQLERQGIPARRDRKRRHCEPEKREAQQLSLLILVPFIENHEVRAGISKTRIASVRQTTRR
jgi:hypothetical protein